MEEETSEGEALQPRQNALHARVRSVRGEPVTRGRLAAEERAKFSLGFETSGQTERFPEGDLVCGKHGLSDYGFELLEPCNGVQGGVGHQKGFGVRVVVLFDHVQDRVPAQRADLGRGVRSFGCVSDVDHAGEGAW
jgi:hypothetical protein